MFICPKVHLSEGSPVRRFICPKVHLSEGLSVLRFTCPKVTNNSKNHQNIFFTIIFYPRIRLEHCVPGNRYGCSNYPKRTLSPNMIESWLQQTGYMQLFLGDTVPFGWLLYLYLFPGSECSKLMQGMLTIFGCTHAPIN